MHHFDIAKYFDFIGGATLDGSRGEKHDVIEYVLTQLDLPKSKIVMVGDTRFDLEGAHKMNLDAIGVTYGFGAKEELCNYPNIALIDDISRIFDFV